jgi:penicillin-binding protein 2
MQEAQEFKDHQREAKLFRNRLIVMGTLVLLLMSILVYRYYDLQIRNYEDYATQSERNRVHVQPIPPTRGLILDRNGELLADNKPSFTLSVTIPDAAELEQTLALLETLIEITPADLGKFYRLRKQQRHSLDPIPLRYKLTEEEIANLAVNQHLLDGVQVDAELVRNYPKGELFAQVIGYTSRINEKEMNSFSEEQLRRYSGTHAIGKVGVEKSYEDVLLGEVGSQNVETNARGRIMRVLDKIDPKQGADVHLHLDIRLQETAVAALRGRRGSVVAIDVKTGGVLAAVSNPSFDPNLFVTGISYRDYKDLNENIDTPLINRFMQGLYPPGSTIKPMLGLAGLHYGFTTPEKIISDPGIFRLPNVERPWRDHNYDRGGHGRVDLKRAIAESCDIYFYDLGNRMGIDRISEFGKHFGLGIRTEIDIPNERQGIWPSREWKKATKGIPWYPGDTINLSIGQGYTLASPLQLAVMTATLANRGVRYKPHLVSAIGKQKIEPEILDRIEVDQKNWDVIFDSMAEVMREGSRGTGRSLVKHADYRMAGKSGTAQVISIAANVKYNAELLEERQWDHAWFIGFAPLEDPQIAIAVIVENGGHGGSDAGPVVRYMFDAYLKGYYLKPGEFVPPMGYHPQAILDRVNNWIEQQKNSSTANNSSTTPAGKKP